MVKFVVLCTKVVAATTAAILFSSCQVKDIQIGDGIDGDGNVTTETRNVENFSKIDVERGLNVTVEQSGTFSVEVEADQNLQSHITAKVDDGTLFITTDENIDEATAKNIHVKMPSLSNIRSSSGSSVTSNGTFKGSETSNSAIDIKASSGSSVDLDLEFDTVGCTASSGSSMALKGKALNLTTDTSSGSEIDARHLLVNDVVAEASSGSSTTVHPGVSLKGKASSGSSIDYDSSPKTVTKEESSGGSVSKE
jgi:hypothetical protein